MTYDESEDFAEKRKYVTDLMDMLALFEIDLAPFRALEVGGEGGMLAGLMAARMTHVTSTDIVNSQQQYGGKMAALLAEKFDRNGETFPMDKVELLVADAQNLQFRDDWFDFCFSQNAFEHIPDPELALKEMQRVTRPGGLIYIMFDPLWTADSGSHFIHRIGEPWLHLLEPDEVIAGRMRANGAPESEISSYQHHMNRRPSVYYREMVPRVVDELGMELLLHHDWSGVVDPAYENHPNLERAAEKLGLSADDLLVRGFRYLIRV